MSSSHDHLPSLKARPLKLFGFFYAYTDRTPPVRAMSQCRAARNRRVDSTNPGADPPPINPVPTLRANEYLHQCHWAYQEGKRRRYGETSMKMTECQTCGLKITFQSIAGKWHPVNLDGTPHHDICRETQNTRFQSKGTPFQDGKGSGFILKGKRQYFTLHGPVITGANYHPKTHTCGVLPWESCNC